MVHPSQTPNWFAVAANLDTDYTHGRIEVRQRTAFDGKVWKLWEFRALPFDRAQQIGGL
jgi:hypothetical protein